MSGGEFVDLAPRHCGGQRASHCGVPSSGEGICRGADGILACHDGNSITASAIRGGGGVE